MPPTLDEINELFARARDEWNKAEESIKAGEQITRKLIVPAIKELRYAGRRFVDTHVQFAGDADLERAKEYLNDGIFNCVCAQHDATDVAISFIAAHLAICTTKIGYEHILRVFPDFHKIYDPLLIVQEKIRISRNDRENRDAVYDNVQSVDLPELSKLYLRFLGSEPLMKALAAKERRANLFKDIVTTASVAIAALACAAAIYNGTQAAHANRRADTAEARLTAANTSATGATQGTQAPK